MPTSPAERTISRKDEIVQACAKLYETLCYKEITIQQIASFTSFSRPSIYNYFRTKEEIFLAYLQREYQCWVDDLTALSPTEGGRTRRALAEEIARSLEKRRNMLKLLSMNLSEIEANSRLENLVEFKAVYGNAIQTVKTCVARFCPDMRKDEIDEFTFSFFPFLFGITPYTQHTEKQIQAMNAAGTEYALRSIYEVALIGTKRLLGG